LRKNRTAIVEGKKQGSINL